MDTAEPACERLVRPRRLPAALAVLAAVCGLARAEGEAVTHTLEPSGRAYELLVPPGGADALAGQPLAVFLHGSGEPKLDRFKADYWPLLRARRCAAAVPKSDDKRMWRYADAQYVTDVIADVEKRYRTDVKRRLLMGVSGGGQTGLFLVDHSPEMFRAVIAVSTNPVVIRRRRYEWFYPSRKTLKTCPYLVINHITQGSALKHWRQVRVAQQPLGASLSILPVLGPVSHYLPPPKELPAWLDAVLAGRHPAPIPDPQKAAVAKMFAKPAAALPKALADTPPASAPRQAEKNGRLFHLTVPVPAGYERPKREERTDSAAKPITQVRIEHAKRAIYVRCEARKTAKPMAEVLKAEQDQTIRRGMLYQLYHRQALAVGGRRWQVKAGSTTYPDPERGWVSTFFLHAAAPVSNEPTRWLEVLVMDETHKPDPPELAGLLRAVLAGIAAGPPRPAAATRPADGGVGRA